MPLVRKMKPFTDGRFGHLNLFPGGGCTLNQCFLGTSVPTEGNEAADVFVEDKYGPHDYICVYFFKICSGYRLI